MATDGQGDDRDRGGGGLVDPNEQVSPPASNVYSDFAGAEQTAESPLPGADGRCVVCGGPTFWGGHGRPRKYCGEHSPRRRPAVPAAPGPPRFCGDDETRQLSRSVAILSPEERHEDLITLAVEDLLRIDGDGRLTEHEVHQRLRATRDGVTGYNLVYADSARALPIRGVTVCREDWPIARNRSVQPLTFATGPMEAGEDRWIYYKLTHQEDSVRTHEFPYRHQRQVPTDALERLRIVLDFDAPARIQRCQWTELRGEPEVDKSSQRPGTHFELDWKPPIPPGRYYGVRWAMAGIPTDLCPLPTVRS